METEAGDQGGGEGLGSAMREFKFRLLNKTTNALFVVDLLNMSTTDASMFGDNQLSYPDNFEWMQFTGLKDKNGVEIYEGDVLAQRPYGYYKKDGTRDGRIKDEWANANLVEWGEWQDFSGGYESEPGTFIGWSINPAEIKEQYPGDINDKLEVIGNIYENPELLND